MNSWPACSVINLCSVNGKLIYDNDNNNDNGALFRNVIRRY